MQVDCPYCDSQIKLAAEARVTEIVCPSCRNAVSLPEKIRVDCECGKAFLAKLQLAGKRVKCPSCSHRLTIPHPSPLVQKGSSGVKNASPGDSILHSDSSVREEAVAHDAPDSPGQEGPIPALSDEEILAALGEPLIASERTGETRASTVVAEERDDALPRQNDDQTTMPAKSSSASRTHSKPQRFYAAGLLFGLFGSFVLTSVLALLAGFLLSLLGPDVFSSTWFVFWVSFALSALGSCVCIFTAWIYRFRVHRIESTPTSNIGEVTNGYREVKGRISAEGGKMLKAPLSGRQCVYYDFRVTEKIPGDADSGPSIKEIIHDTKSIGWYVDDGTGVASVEFDGAVVELTPTVQKKEGSLNTASARIEEVLSKYGESGKSRGLLFECYRELGCKETVLREGDELYVLGPAKRVKGRVHFVAGLFRRLIVSNKSEYDLLSHYEAKTRKHILLAVLLPVAPFVLALIFLLVNWVEFSGHWT